MKKDPRVPFSGYLELEGSQRYAGSLSFGAAAVIGRDAGVFFRGPYLAILD